MQEPETAVSNFRIKPLLPNEPRIVNRGKESKLTQDILIPALPSIEALFWEIRSRLDPVLSERQPLKLGKPYPLGQCLEISKAVEDQIKTIDPTTLVGMPLEGHIALKRFLRQGGTMRQVWGDLRREYFQNAFLVGTLYIDASNDTVVTTKPKVEVLPFEDANFKPIEDFGHYAKIAARYWKANVFPNHLIPTLAPFVPMIVAIPNGSIQFQLDSDYMIGLATTSQFQLSEQFLEAPVLDKTLFEFLKKHLPETLFNVPNDPMHGRKQAVDNCRAFRSKRWHLSTQQRDKAIINLRKANQCLALLRVTAGSS